MWGRASRESALSEVEGSKPSNARQLSAPPQLVGSPPTLNFATFYFLAKART